MLFPEMLFERSVDGLQGEEKRLLFSNDFPPKHRPSALSSRPQAVERQRFAFPLTGALGHDDPLLCHLDRSAA